MTERMLLEALIEHYGIATIASLIVQICDAKAAESVAYGEMKAAKSWAERAAQFDRAVQ